MENKVAKIMKNIAYTYAACFLIVSVIVYCKIYYYVNGGEMQFFMILIAGLLTSVFIYAFGEIIDLLQAIKNNTTTKSEDAALPPL